MTHRPSQAIEIGVTVARGGEIDLAGRRSTGSGALGARGDGLLVVIFVVLVVVRGIVVVVAAGRFKGFVVAVARQERCPSLDGRVSHVLVAIVVTGGLELGDRGVARRMVMRRGRKRRGGVDGGVTERDGLPRDVGV
jgi:hypothetical protein